MRPEVLLDHNAKALLVFKRGHVNIHAVAIATPVKVVKLPLAEGRWLRPLMFKGKPYPIKRAVRAFRQAGRALGITDGAKEALGLVKEAE